MKDLLVEERALAPHPRRNPFRRPIAGDKFQTLEKRVHVIGGGGLIQRDPDPSAVEGTQVVTPILRRAQKLLRPSLQRDGDGVEEVLPLRFHPGLPQPVDQPPGQSVNPVRDLAQPPRPVVNGIHRGDHRQEHLGGADVGGRLLPTDVLLTGLQGQPVGRPAGAVHRDSHQSARKPALEGITARQVGRMRTAESQRHPESLGRSDAQVRPEGGRFFQHGEGQGVRRHHQQASEGMHLLREDLVIVNGAQSVGILDEGPDQPAPIRHLHPLPVANHQVDPDRLGPGPQDVQRLRMAVPVGKEDGPLPIRPRRQGHRLRRRGPLVQQRGVGHIHPGQVGNDRLEVEQGFQAPLRDFSLVGSVGRVPSRVLKDIALDHGRHDGAVIALPDERFGNPVARHDPTQLPEGGGLGQCLRQNQLLLEADRFRNRIVDQLLERLVTELPQHLRAAFRRRTDVPLREARGYEH